MNDITVCKYRNAILAYADMSYEERSGIFDKQYALTIDAIRDVSPSEFVKAIYPIIQPKVGELWGSNVRGTKAIILEAHDNTVMALERDGLKLRYIINMALDDFLKLNKRIGNSKYIKGLFNELDYYCQLDDKMEF